MATHTPNEGRDWLDLVLFAGCFYGFLTGAAGIATDLASLAILGACMVGGCLAVFGLRACLAEE